MNSSNNGVPGVFKGNNNATNQFKYYQLSSFDEESYKSDGQNNCDIHVESYGENDISKSKARNVGIFEIDSKSEKHHNRHRSVFIVLVSCSVFVIAILATWRLLQRPTPSLALPVESGAWSSKADPFSIVDPASLGFKKIDRPQGSKPGSVFGDLQAEGVPLPTNNWYQNLLIGGNNNRNSDNNAFQVPYIIDTAGFIPGIRMHPSHLQANDRVVMMTYERQNGLTIGGIEAFNVQHKVKDQRSDSDSSDGSGSEKTYFAMTKLAVELEWSSSDSESVMRSPIVRGSPYVTMIYDRATPRVFSERPLSGIILDQKTNINTEASIESLCGNKFGEFSDPFHVDRELVLTFEESDMSWMVFVSRPMMFVCSNLRVTDALNNLPPGVVPKQNSMMERSYFELRAVTPTYNGSPVVLRVAMSNNCTYGVNIQNCDSWDGNTAINHNSNGKVPRDQSELENIFRSHSEILPTGKANIQFAFPVESKEEEELNLIFDWQPISMYSIDKTVSNSCIDCAKPPYSTELLMYALPHHQERMQATSKSSNVVLNNKLNSNDFYNISYGFTCLPTIHGHACLVIGGQWSLLEHLHKVSFSALSSDNSNVPPSAVSSLSNAIRSDLHSSLKKDILYDVPPNYRIGAGDTYFSGKMLAKLARIIVIADENPGAVDPLEFKDALSRLKDRLSIWFNGSALSPFLYDPHWGGVVMCGCEYFYTPPTDTTGPVYGCRNSFPNCPAVVDAGSNFGAGFFNDHHYHYGYFIYSAAVLAKFDSEWALKYEDHVMFLIRDIGNPSYRDPYFPVWRHKDWYLGFSWASGVVTMKTNFPNTDIYPGSCSTESSVHSNVGPDVVPYPNGRNQESSSEAIFAYEAMALFGATMADVYAASIEGGAQNKDNNDKLDSMQRVRDMGRLLLATEIRSAKAYYHVIEKASPGMPRIYPEVYKPKVVGMIWSLLVQEQTWFGNEPWKSYGIQLLPISPAAEQRDSIEWLSEMYPIFNESCNDAPTCRSEGFSILLSTTLAAMGRSEEAHSMLMSLDDDVFEKAGGNGHSLSNCLWWILSRPNFEAQ